VRRKRESINHDQRAIAIILTLLLLLTLTGVCAAQSEETGTTEEILNILKQRGIVTGEEYEDLKKKAEEEKKKEEKEYTVKWNNGINVDRNDGAFKVKIGGRIHLDWGDINPDSALKRNNRNGVYGDNELNGNGAEFRRARLYVDGTLWERFLFKAQYDFAGQDADFKDVYLGLRDIPFLGILRVGQMKEPISLEELTSSNYITFMERSLPVVAFAPSRKTGIEVNNTILNKRMTWGVGAFYGDTDDDGDSDFNNNTRADIAFRLTGLPFYDDDGRRLLHLGLGYLFQARSEGGDRLRYRTRPESHLTDVRLVDTGSIAAKNANLLNPEIAFVWGPFSLQGEYFWNKVDSTEANDPTFQGAYFFGSWFITGENRPYSTKGGTFSRIKPKRNFLDDGGFGAWELALRWSWIDLNDENIQGGEENNFTVGLNWYLNPNYRLMFNYVYADVKDRGPIEDADGNLILTEDGDANIFQMRFQVDF
jgi:phosphate-selective porin OprO/OprP